MLRRGVILFALPSSVYQLGVSQGRLRADGRQMEALAHVDRAYHDIVRLASTGVPRRDVAPASPSASAAAAFASAAKPQRGSIEPERSGGFFSSFLNKPKPIANNNGPRTTTASTATQQKKTAVNKAPHALSLTKGIYLHGDVGCGKTYLMDLLYQELPPSLLKRRVHFHQFMQQVHKDMHAIKQEHGKSMDGDQLMLEVAKRQCRDAEVLCFDELVVADVSDAMILRRLFDSMYAVGVIAIYTSNRAPKDLYQGGLNRGSFLPFIDLLHERCHIHDMSSQTDHRLAGTVSETYLYPVNAANTEKFNRAWTERTGGKPETLRTLKVFGRDLLVRRAVGGVCRFTFRELCNTDTSVADFSEIARHFHTFFLEDVPRLNAGNSDSKRRFITLLDELYQYKVKIVVLANAAPDDLEMRGAGGENADGKPQADMNEETFYAGQLIGAGEDKFQMRRAVSRLQEMRSREYAKERYLGDAKFM